MKFTDWKAFTPEKAAAELPRLLDAARKAVEKIKKLDAPVSYGDLVPALNEATRPLYRMWGDVRHMLSVMNSEAWRDLQDKFQSRMVEFSLSVGQSAALYRLAKSALAGEGLNPVRRRILERMVQGAELSGVGLEGAAKARFNEIAAKLAKLGSDFHNAVIDATTPEISDAVFPETMKHNPDRALREKLYRQRVTRAPENAARIDEILALRDEEARILGFADYAEKSLAVKCAPSVAAVYSMIDRLDAATVGPAAAEAVEGEPWDKAFNAERLRERLFSYSEEELKKHFEFSDVLKGLFKVTSFLFGVEVEELEGGRKPSVWHDDVRFFAVRENGEEIAYFYLDPYVRVPLKSGGAWMNDFGSKRPGHLPVAVIVLNLPPRDENGKCFMPMREVETLFHEFGHALQHMLTRVDEEDAAGINLVEWDAVEVASQFMENWCLDERTGIKVPEKLKAGVKAAKNFLAATQCRRQLAFAKLDLDLHTGKTDDPNGVKNAAFARFSLPSVPEDRFLDAFTHIFAGGYAAGYYGYKWAEVMSADCYGAFEEAGLENDDAVAETGRRYRESVLALGGSKSALEVFRVFRGRDPDIAALLRQQGLA
jgi:oligopeptidase A